MTTSNPIAAVISKNEELGVIFNDIMTRKQLEDEEGFYNAIKDCSSEEEYVRATLTFIADEMLDLWKNSKSDFENIIMPYVSGRVVDFKEAIEVIRRVAFMSVTQGYEIWDTFTEDQKVNWADACASFINKCVASHKDCVDSILYTTNLLTDYSERMVN